MSPRRHVVDGKELVVLHVDGETTLLRIEAREWSVLEAADGTRDIEGIALAARRLGGNVAPVRVAQFLAGLESRGLLEEGPPEHHPTAVSLRPRGVPDDRPLEILPAYAFSCDGRGGCCRFYATVLFTPADVARAHVFVPDHSVDIVPTERLFTPAHGSASTPIVVPVQRDGACGFLGADGLCEIHRAGGLHAKPYGCAAFPLRLCDDGTAVRVSAQTECGCVLRSAVGQGGDTLLPVGATQARDLPLVSAVESLPESVPVAGERTWPRERVRALVSELVAALPVDDAAAWAWCVADAIEADAAIPTRVEPPRAAVVEPWARALAEQVSARANRDAAWRSPADVTMRALRWMTTTAAVALHGDLLDALLHTPAAEPAIESFWLRANLWAYVDIADLGFVPMLRDRAVRLWLARAMPELATHDVRDPAFAEPLAVIDVLMRGHGLVRYVSTITG